MGTDVFALYREFAVGVSKQAMIHTHSQAGTVKNIQ